jgi:nucleotide-binding universal stress UspA family protein
MSKTILLAIDPTSYSPAAADMARDLAGGSGDRVVVLHVHEFAVGRFGRIQVDCPEGEGERVVAEIVESLRGDGVDATAEVRKTYLGHIAKAIVAVSDEIDARMIILGSTKAHDLPRLSFGSVSLRLLHLSDKPVMIVPRSSAPVHATLSAATAAAR